MWLRINGREMVAEARLQLARRFAASCVLAEAMEAKMAQWVAIDINEHCNVSGAATRIAVRIGLNRRPNVPRWDAIRVARGQGKRR
jgi:hypothetical protein